MLRRRAVLASPALLATPALAQPYPGPVRIIVPFAPGGTTDIITRLIADEMARRLSTTIVVENRPGAGATLGTGLVARAAPDGQTLLVSTISGMAVGHTLYRDRIQWDADRDFAHIAIMLGTPYLLLVHPAQPIRTVADFIAAAKRPPGLAYATSGIGSVPHLIGLRLAQAAGFELQHIPYRGGAQAATDAIAGVVPSVMDSLTAASAYIRAGSLRVIAFTTRERVPDFPEVPTFVESGFPDIVADGWAGIAAPAGTPRPLQERLAGAIREAIAAPAVARRYAETSTLPGTRFLDDAQAFVRSEI
ncbi:tripartite tricarboxylate transporter substrate binding protein, partial [Roseomonas alkaliterrae]